MGRNPRRTTAALALLVVVWIVVYWIWEPSEPSITFADPEPAVIEAAPASDPPAASPGDEPVAEPDDEGPQATHSVVEPEFERYVVRDGETFDSIAKARFGREVDWRILARANPLTDPDRIKEGDVIWIPLDPENIQGRSLPVESVLAEANAPPVVIAPFATEERDTDSEPTIDAAQAPVMEYTVRSGETLSEIARRFYGSISFTRGLYLANRDVLASPDAVGEGQVLKIPPKEALPDG